MCLLWIKWSQKLIMCKILNRLNVLRRCKTQNVRINIHKISQNCQMLMRFSNQRLTPLSIVLYKKIKSMNHYHKKMLPIGLIQTKYPWFMRKTPHNRKRWFQNTHQRTFLNKNKIKLIHSNKSPKYLFLTQTSQKKLLKEKQLKQVVNKHQHNTLNHRFQR